MNSDATSIQILVYNIWIIMQNVEIDIACKDIMSTSHTNDDTVYIKIGMYIKHGINI